MAASRRRRVASMLQTVIWRQDCFGRGGRRAGSLAQVKLHCTWNCWTLVRELREPLLEAPRGNGPLRRTWTGSAEILPGRLLYGEVNDDFNRLGLREVWPHTAKRHARFSILTKEKRGGACFGIDFWNAVEERLSSWSYTSKSVKKGREKEGRRGRVKLRAFVTNQMLQFPDRREEVKAYRYVMNYTEAKLHVWAEIWRKDNRLIAKGTFYWL